MSDCGKFRRTKKKNEMIHQSVQKKNIMGDKTVRVRADLHHINKNRNRQRMDGKRKRSYGNKT